MTKTSFNRLENEKSTYLQLHKDGPIDWWSFGPEAIEYAQRENLPIFLSIGSSVCHMCRSMEVETFRNEEIAELLNEKFVCINVDKDEYPDLENYYQQSNIIFSKGNGWPVTAFLLPNMMPYFTGSYYPTFSNEHGPGFKDLIIEMSRAFNDQHDQATKNAEEASKLINDGPVPKGKVEFEGHFPHPSSIMEAIKQFQDETNGGFGTPPKFPIFSFYEWALEQMLEGMIQKEQGEHIIKSLESILMGGIHDHLRGGIHRHSLDDTWTVPHFEKMLYDQAGFLKVLSKMSLLYQSPLVFDALINTLDYIKTELTSKDGYFFSGQSSDSEGVEGLYFSFTEEEFEDAIAKSDDQELTGQIDEIKKWFCITKTGDLPSNLNIIRLNTEQKDSLFSKETWTLIRKVKKHLLEIRKTRIPPTTDNKGVASWNFMMLSALCDVMQFCQVDAIRKAAMDIFNETLPTMYNNFIKSRDNKKMSINHSTSLNLSIPYLEDYVFFAESMIRAYELTGNSVFKQNLKETLDFIIQEFVNENKLFIRATNTDQSTPYPNLLVHAFDQYFKSTGATLIGVIKRSRALFEDADLGIELKDIEEEYIHEALKNPLGSGEALRSFTYPEQSYRLIKVPKNWTLDPTFVNFIPYFLPRFVFQYQLEEESENWEICSSGGCELKGEGIEEFMNALRPKETEKQ
ncbi:MAG: thioredoxin domain-containing protein [Bdellovibrionales bacterium]|nr:thioredoxin domain-containing protein [Bdellovibrionales bacterium]